jgi:hypothetical protein
MTIGNPVLLNRWFLSPGLPLYHQLTHSGEVMVFPVGWGFKYSINLVGGLEHEFYFSHSVGNNHPN